MEEVTNWRPLTAILQDGNGDKRIPLVVGHGIRAQSGGAAGDLSTREWQERSGTYVGMYWRVTSWPLI